MNWTKTPPTQEGWYYLREDERDDWCIVEVWPKVDGGFFIGDGKDVADINALGYEWGGRVPAPGTTWNMDEIKVYLESQLELIDDLSNRRLELAIREIDDTTYGIAAVTARNKGD